ncbi:RraA family protein [Arthrobacter liuii]|uniref:Putative 4-hydroxy-4-methyl-2-oxoglutarate aldolase n=1 Tax=Arthrobacter liuii TaxID=1476996 RepID=A0ABQ2B1P1_9MICC|nr:methyltransferase [Arthrobacter liuii]GGI02479.1 methyltransferase [Arthrobacter liuii]
MTLSTQQLSRRLGALPTPNIGDAMERLGVLDASIKPVWPGARLAGPAFTVWTRAGDNAYLHRALAEATPGDVIVVNGQGDESRALMGDLIGARARNAGIAGFVIDGAVRDAAGLERLGMPVFARSISPAGPYKNGPGSLAGPVAVGGVAVLPGDIMIGDEDGTVVVPRARAEEVLLAAEAVRVDEDERMRTILAQADKKESGVAGACVAR